VAGGQVLLDGQVQGGEQVADLVGDAGVEAADGVGRQLGQVSGDDAPGALDQELHEDSTEDEERNPVRRENEQRDYGESEAGGEDDRPTPA
jgi:hypothetical protein